MHRSVIVLGLLAVLGCGKSPTVADPPLVVGAFCTGLEAPGVVTRTVTVGGYTATASVWFRIIRFRWVARADGTLFQQEVRSCEYFVCQIPWTNILRTDMEIINLCRVQVGEGVATPSTP